MKRIYWTNCSVLDPLHDTAGALFTISDSCRPANPIRSMSIRPVNNPCESSWFTCANRSTTKSRSASRIRVQFAYKVKRPADGKLLAEGRTVHAATGPDGIPRRMPSEILDDLEVSLKGVGGGP